MIELINITADPYEEDDLFENQFQERKEQLKEVIKNNTCIKIEFDNGLYEIISPAFEKECDKRVTYYSREDKPQGHKEFNFNDYTFRDVINNYMYDCSIKEIIK